MPENIIAELGVKAAPVDAGGGLLGRMSARILDEKRQADQRLDSMVNEMLRLVEESVADGQRRRVPQAVQSMIVAGFIMVVFVALVFTPAAKIADLSWIGDFGAVLTWLSVSLAIVVSSWFVLATSGDKGKVAAIISATLFGGSVAAALNPSIQASAFVSTVFGSNAGDWVFWPITVGVAITGMTARLVVSRSVGEWRSALSRFIGIATIAFLLGWMVVLSSRADSFPQTEARYQQELIDSYDIVAAELEATTGGPSACRAAPSDPGTAQALRCRMDRHTERVDHFSDSLRQRLLVSGLVFGTLLFTAGVAAISVLWVRVELRNRDRGARFRFATDEAIHASRARRRLQFFMTQWLGVASALSRIVWRPLGEVSEIGRRDADPLQADAGLLKLQVAELRLTPHGEEILLERLRSLIVRPGWLTDQYRRAADAYAADDPRILAADLPREDWPRPETCPYTPAIEDVLDGTAEGMRWGFVRSLYSGALDRTLQEKLADYSPAEIYRVLLDSEQAASVHELAAGTATPESGGSTQDFFQDVLPERKPRLPSGVVDQTFVANDERAQMTPFLCWPDDLLPDVDIDCERLGSRATDFGEPVITAVRCDVSGPFKLGDLEVLDQEIEIAQSPIDPIDLEPGL